MYYTNDTSGPRVLYKRHECDTSEKILVTTRVKTYFHTPILAYERLQGKKQFHSKNYLLEMPHFYARTRLKSAQQKLNLVMAKAISKSYTLDCSCIIIITDLFIVDNLR